MNIATINLKQAELDPASVFEAPEDVVTQIGLTRGEKVQILRRWEYDAAELDVAEEEGMGGSDSGLLTRVLAALESLGASGHTASPPTKQGVG